MRLDTQTLTTMRRLLLGPAALALALFALACGGGPAPRISNVLEELQPGTTLHTVDVSYRRYGPAAETYARYFPDNGPETLRHETWMEFDNSGNLIAMRSESRTEDGKLEDDELVYEEKDVEVRRIQVGDFTVDEYKTRVREAFDVFLSELEEQPETQVEALRGVEVTVLEERREFTRTLQPASPNSYSAPYLYDLQPVEEIRRSFVALDVSASYRSEIAVVGRDGTETVVESTDHLVVEVLRP